MRVVFVIISLLISSIPNVSFAHKSNFVNYSVKVSTVLDAYKLAHQYHDSLLEIQGDMLILNLSEKEYLQLKNTDHVVYIGVNNDHVFDSRIKRNSLTKLVNKSSDSNVELTIPEFECYNTVEGTYAEAKSQAIAHPELVQWKKIGESWKKTQKESGYDLNVLVIGADQKNSNKPKLFLQSGLHAREYAPVALNLAFAKYLITNQGVDPEVDWILDNTEIHLLLVANPDGRKKAEEGLWWRKNTNNNYCSDEPNRMGVDLNRNYTFNWFSIENGSSGDECMSTFRGHEKGSEPEIQAIEAYVRSIFPDSRGPNVNDAAPTSTPGLFIDIHSAGGMVMWPWSTTVDPAPNAAGLQRLGRRFAAINGYRAFQSSNLYPADGVSTGLGYGELGIASIIFEIGTQFFESCQTYEQEVLPNNLRALMYAAKAAISPYTITKGPEVVGIRLEGSGQKPVPSGTNINLKANVSDALFRQLADETLEASQSIKQVLLTISHVDTAEVTKEIQLSAADGEFDSNNELISYVLNTENWSEGRYSLYMKAQDQDGNWGTVKGASLVIDNNIENQNVLPTADFSFECADLECIVSGDKSTDDGELTYRWLINDRAPLFGKSVSFNYYETGEYKIVLQVEDEFGFVASTEKTLTLQGIIVPVAVLEYSCDGLICDFDSSKSSDTDGQITHLEWYIDGIYQADYREATFQYEFPVAGTYVIGLFVVDNHNAYDFKEISVEVKDKPVPVKAIVKPVKEASKSGGALMVLLTLLISCFYIRRRWY
ncbi:M14 family zinc carboxypeptidase [Pseudoalteromonas aurantia]|uniref:PKD domain-containing protein n=1 Tax=Pseudoalteromonas aurantia TaxID=43654 RepID=A0ABY2VUP7_9GAMM|nr:M14 family zinc carboxypeptidase [Pseudoalteromonas aurantia]TMO72242.1 hypothetical protein CWC20_15525 [Pseudoalteromonas aurantia]